MTKTPSSPPFPRPQGLYDPSREKDSCGIGFAVDIRNRKSRRIIDRGLSILCNVTHRGAVGADPRAGDGVGMSVQIPDGFFRPRLKKRGISLPDAFDYGVAMTYLPAADAEACRKIVEDCVTEEGQHFLGWRDVPVNPKVLGKSIAPHAPILRQAWIGKGAATPRKDFERALFFIRKRAENAVLQRIARHPGGTDFHIASCSSRTLVYKGMIMADVFGRFFPDVMDPDFTSALALVHQRFSTNTFPSWSLAQPFRYLCHNGEINTLRGNLNWMKARRQGLGEGDVPRRLHELHPLVPEGLSDSACLDHALDIMLAGGYDLAHAVMTLIPEAWNSNPSMDARRRDFYRYHGTMMEPWDGPAAIAFTDGRQIGAVLDRNGLRPARYLITEDDQLILASEMGVIDIPEETIVRKWRLQPGKILLADLEQGRIIDDREIKEDLAGRRPWRRFYDRSVARLEDLPPRPPASDFQDTAKTAASFGYTREDREFYLKPMMRDAMEPIGSMGNDTPVSILSEHSRLLYTYFKQCFAQVTNPAIDPIREELVMDLTTLIGAKSPLFGQDDEAHRLLEASDPILDEDAMGRLRAMVDNGPVPTALLDITHPEKTGMEKALDALCGQALKAVEKGNRILILSDRATGPERIAIPALLAVAAVHHHLIRHSARTRTGLVIETGEAREPHHVAVLASYGAQAIHPWLALRIVADLAKGEGIAAAAAAASYRKALGKSILKIMSKIGISTYASYCGAQIFDAIGLHPDVVERHFTGTASRIGGVGLDQIARQTQQRHHRAWHGAAASDSQDAGEYAFRVGGETHAWTPDTIAHLQHAVRGESLDRYRAFAEAINRQDRRMLNLRSLMTILPAGDPIDPENVEPVETIVRRFSTGAMSFGSISREAHTTLAIGMNRIGGKSNTGEGGEERDRFTPMENGDSMRSAIKQVASGRFGVTAEYLVNADDIQIKICQGAKPGEGGQLPGHKVDHTIAAVRHSTPGVGLISPPPHHDIYSIEDLAQLIFDLKNVNEDARISVKLVSEVGVGTVAAGVAKARADHVTISGYDGGTGASPLTSIKHAGLPWEIGLAETQQTLVLNHLRERICVQVDGGLRTGRDVVIGALLGADEFGFSTAPLISIGCIMMRKCHLNTCPVGIATQNPILRQRFTGLPEHVIRYFFFVAEDIRGIMARMGIKRFEDLIGRSDLLEAPSALKAHHLDLSPIFHRPKGAPSAPGRNVANQDHPIRDILDRTVIARAAEALEKRRPLTIEAVIRNTDRSFGAMLSGRIARAHGHEGLPEDCLTIRLRGSAGQSFGAFLARGVTVRLTGEGNDYVGKGLSGGKIIISPSPKAPFDPSENIIVGNTVLYGAVCGECYFHGIAGERFAVRNSGAIAVVEGVGDHGCEYMTGGCVVVLGPTGRNFAAGMSGGIAYVYDPEGTFSQRCNREMVDVRKVRAEALVTGRIGHAWFTGMEEGMARPLEDDAQRLYTLIGHHYHHTNSRRARHILDHWHESLGCFVKVTPHDFRRALGKDPKRRVA